VAAPRPIKGASVRVFAAQTLATLAAANRRLRDDGAFYADVRQHFSN